MPSWLDDLHLEIAPRNGTCTSNQDTLPSRLIDHETDIYTSDRETCIESQDALATSKKYPSQDPQFLECLKRCESIDNLRSWAAKYDIELRKYRRLAFQQLVDSGQPLSRIFEALEDKALNTLGNLEIFLSKQSKRSMTLDDARSIAQWIKKGLFLGNENVKVLSDFVFRVVKISGPEQLKTILIGSITEGLQSSLVSPFKYLHHSTACLLLESTTFGTFGTESQNLGFRIIKALGHSRLRKMDNAISAFVQKALQASVAHNELESSESTNLEVVPIIVEMLQSLPQKTATSVILSTSKALVNRKRDVRNSSNPLYKLVDQWWSALARSNIFDFVGRNTTAIEIELMMAYKELAFIVPYLKHFDDHARARFVLLYRLRPILPLHLQRLKLRHFERRCESKGNSSPFVHMVHALRKGGFLSTRNLHVIFHLLQELQMSTTIIGIIVSSRKARSDVDKSAVLRATRRHVHANFQVAKRMFIFCRQMSFEKCPELAEAMILNPAIHHNTAVYYLQHRRLPEDYNRARDWEQLLKARSRLIEKMALAYSKAFHIRTRVSFRLVQRCYHVHKYERLGPPPVGIALAITRAGIIRPLEANEWVTTSRVRWMLSVIRKIEGGAVAAKVDEILYECRGFALTRLRRMFHRQNYPRDRLGRLLFGRGDFKDGRGYSGLSS